METMTVELALSGLSWALFSMVSGIILIALAIIFLGAVIWGTLKVLSIITNGLKKELSSLRPVEKPTAPIIKEGYHLTKDRKPKKKEMANEKAGA